jgi:hypothetical protein
LRRTLGLCGRRTAVVGAAASLPARKPLVV